MDIDSSPSKRFRDEIGSLDASPVPSESVEQSRLFQWARMQQGRWPELKLLYHIPNGGSRHRLEAIHLKQQSR